MCKVSIALMFMLTACSTDTFVATDGGDAGPADAGSGTIQCKGTPRACFTNVESCCLRTDQLNDECIKRPPEGTVDCPDAQGFVLACDDESDCPLGMACCATTQPGAISSTCVAPLGCVGPNRGKLCSASASPSQCPIGKDCTPLANFPRYSACQ